MDTVNVETPTLAPTPAPLEKAMDTVNVETLAPALSTLAAAEAEFRIYDQKFTDARSAVIQACAALLAATDEARAFRKSTEDYEQSRHRINAVNADLERVHKAVRDRANAVDREHRDAVTAAKALKGREARAEAVKVADAAARLASETVRMTPEEHEEVAEIYVLRGEAYAASDAYHKIHLDKAAAYGAVAEAIVPADLSDRRFMLDRTKQHAFALIRVHG
jgi:hypothetical protein